MSITSRPATAIIIALAAFLTATRALACSSATPRAGDVNTDRAALAALYNATNGSGWQYDTNWLSNQPLGEWEGVSTNPQSTEEMSVGAGLRCKKVPLCFWDNGL